MSSSVVRDLAGNIMGTAPTNNNFRGLVDPYAPPMTSQSPIPISSSSDLEPHVSVLSDEVDRWISGDTNSINAGVQSRISPQTAQRSTLVSASSLEPRSGFWYLAAMVLPLFSLNQHRNWRCSPSTIIRSAEALLTDIVGLCRRARIHLRHRLTEEPPRDLFAFAMDIVLVVYVVGFLLLSLYQASVFRRMSDI